MSRKDQKARTRSTILQAARDLFAERGYEAATMRELATRAGVAVGTINLHFADKTSLLAAALDEDIEAALAGAEVPADASLERRLEALIRPLYAYYAERPDLSRVLVKESLLLAGVWGRHFTEQLARGEPVAPCRLRYSLRRDSLSPHRFVPAPRRSACARQQSHSAQ